MAAGGSIYEELDELLRRESLKDIRQFLNDHKKRINIQFAYPSGERLVEKIEQKSKQIQKVFKEILADQYAAINRVANNARARGVVAAHEAERAARNAAAANVAAEQKARENAERAERSRDMAKMMAEVEPIQKRTKVLETKFDAYLEDEDELNTTKLDELINDVLLGVNIRILSKVLLLPDPSLVYFLNTLETRASTLNTSTYTETEKKEVNTMLRYIREVTEGKHIDSTISELAPLIRYYLQESLSRITVSGSPLFRFPKRLPFPEAAHRRYTEIMTERAGAGAGAAGTGVAPKPKPKILVKSNVPKPTNAAKAESTPAPTLQNLAGYGGRSNIEGFRRTLKLNPSLAREALVPLFVPGETISLSFLQKTLQKDPTDSGTYARSILETLGELEEPTARQVLNIAVAEGNIPIIIQVLQRGGMKTFSKQDIQHLQIVFRIKKIPYTDGFTPILQVLDFSQIGVHSQLAQAVLVFSVRYGLTDVLAHLPHQGLNPFVTGWNSTAPYCFIVDILFKITESELVSTLLPAYSIKQWNQKYKGQSVPFQLIRSDISLFKELSRLQLLYLLAQKGVDLQQPDSRGYPTSVFAPYGGSTLLQELLTIPSYDARKELDLIRTFITTNGMPSAKDALLIATNTLLNYLTDNGAEPEEVLQYITSIPGLLYNQQFRTMKQTLEQKVRAKKPYTGYRQAELRLLDELLLFPTDFSICPICLTALKRTEGCLYMKHDCRASGFYHEDLYEKYKDAEGKITWCTMCSRIANSFPVVGGLGHKHYQLALTSQPKPGYAAIPPGQTEFYFDRNCLTQGGGGVLEKFVRMRRFREYAFELQGEVGTISDWEARTQLVEEMWNSFVARQPAAKKVLNRAQTVGADILKAAQARAGAGGDFELTPEEVAALDAIWTETGQVPTSKFLANNTITAVNRAALAAQQAANARFNAEAQKNLAWPNAGNATRQPVRGAGECPVCLEDKAPLWTFGHPVVGGAGAIHEPICEQCLEDAIKNKLGTIPVTASTFGKCWSEPCQYKLWPQELAGKIPDGLLERYRIAFNKHMLLQQKGGAIPENNINRMPFLNPEGAPVECSLPQRSGTQRSGTKRNTRKRRSNRRKTRKA